MVFRNVYKHLYQSKVIYPVRIIKSKENRFENFQWYQEQKLLKASIDINCTPKRFLSGGFNFDINPDSSQVQLPPLTDDKPILWQNIFSFFLTPLDLSKLIFYNQKFNIEEFFTGSKQALEIVSNAIAAEDFDSLKGLVTDNVTTKVKNGIIKLSEVQKQLIPILKEDICYIAPAKININKENIQEANNASVEITMIYYSYRRKQEETKKAELIHFKSIDKMIISNCRFKQEYINNIPSSSWIITMYNQFTILSLRPQFS